MDNLAFAEHRDRQLGFDQLAVVVHMANVERPKVPVKALVHKLFVCAEVVRVVGVLRLGARLKGDKVEAVCE